MKPFEDEPVRIEDDPNKLPPELRSTWDGLARRWFFRTWPPQKLLPDAEPISVRSWHYVFGVATLASMIFCFASGMFLGGFGPGWWIKSGFGAWMGAMHYWSVQLFFLFMLAHFIAVFLMGAFRGQRKLTWMLGVLSFMTAAVTGLTGFVSLQNFEGQWVATQAKDAINSTGIGGLFNLLNTGQILTLHVIVLPVALLVIVGAHLLWVRKRGIAPPYDAAEDHLEPLPDKSR